MDDQGQIYFDNEDAIPLEDWLRLLKAELTAAQEKELAAVYEKEMDEDALPDPRA